MRAYKKGDHLLYCHAATLAMNIIAPQIASRICLYEKLPELADPKEFHRVSIEVVKTKKEMAAYKSRMRQARKRILSKIPKP